MSDTKLEFSIYSDKCVVIKGTETKKYKEGIKDIGGKWNATIGGWIFPIKLKNTAEEFVERALSGKIKHDVMTDSNQHNIISKTDFNALLSKVEKLEIKIAQLEKIIKNNIQIDSSESSDSDNSNTKKVEKITKFRQTKPTKKVQSDSDDSDSSVKKIEKKTTKFKKTT